MSENGYDNISIKGLKKGNPKLKANGLVTGFYQTKESLEDFDIFNKFIKACESMIRTSKEYKRYIKYLKEDIGLNYDMTMPNITSGEGKKTKVEMHHGPILTLYDYCAICTDHLLKNNIPVTTFRIARLILKEHQLNHVRVVMLSTMNHKLIDTGDLWLDCNMGWGDQNKFLENYKDGINKKMKEIINNNIDISQQIKSHFKDGIADINILRWDDR